MLRNIVQKHSTLFSTAQTLCEHSLHGQFIHKAPLTEITPQRPQLQQFRFITTAAKNTNNNNAKCWHNKRRLCSRAAAATLSASRLYTVVIQPTSTPKKKMTKLTEQERTEQLPPLLNAGWSMVNGRDAIHKEYLFNDFNRAFSFMAGVALLAEKMNHHPEWFNVYNKVQVTMSTHDVGGLSAKDIRMAKFMEEQANRLI